MILHDKQIAIVGGGPGGLTLARLLQLKGVNLKVYERDLNARVRVQGATLDLHEESGLEAMRRAGLIDRFYALYRPEAGKLRIMDKHATILLDDHTAQSHDENRPEIDRGPLREMLLDSLQENTVVWDSAFLSMEKKGEGWMLHFKNGTSAYADVVIAADGANSKIRLYITGIKPIYSGITVVEGTIGKAAENAPKLYEMVKGGKVFAFGDSQSLILSAKGDGCLSFYTGCLVPENWTTQCGIDFTDKEQVFHWFREAYGSWDPVWMELFGSADVSCYPRPQYHFPPDQQWETQPNLTMLGDAAHRMPPYAGEGVNMALQDAFELAECLTGNNYNSVQEAIAHFEHSMCQRAAEVTQISLDSTDMLHSDDAVAKMLRMMSGEE